MRVSRIYCSQVLAVGAEVNLSIERSHYVQQVLRLKLGHLIHIFNETQGEFAAEIISLSKKSVIVKVGAAQDNNTESKLTTHLAQGLSRGERMDFVIQKAVELGVNVITPLLTSRCEVKLTGERLNKRLQHWRHIAISACEQNGRIQVPSILPPLKLDDWLGNIEADLKLICDTNAEHTLTQGAAVQSVALLIGPEGGFAQAEIESAKQHQFQSWRIGPRVLRTETAPVVALSLLQSAFGDF